MKKTLLLLLSIFTLSFQQSSATIHAIGVSDFQFSPSSLSVVVGDTIVWGWASGSHTTTSTVIPSGAPAWNSSITMSTPTFSYVVTTPGQYSYVCQPHSGAMQGSFTATSVGIKEQEAATFTMQPRVVQGQLMLDYKLTSTNRVSLSLFDVTGKQVMEFENMVKQAGTYSERYIINSLPSGVYLLKLETPVDRVVKKITIH